MRKSLIVPVVLLALASSGAALAKDPTPERGPSIQIALLLDTSNSMDGLIVQAKTQLWTVVNQFIKARRDGRPPRLEVALFEYGNMRLSPHEGFIRRVLPLTDDLDKVSEELFALTTNGGEEYCGQVIRDAVERLEWSDSRATYKAIFIAGNEPFTQGTVDYRDSCRAAIGKGILVNTIYCDRGIEADRVGWKEGALLADGQYLAIDHHKRIVDIPAPQDKEIARLNASLNETYIPYGRGGRAGQLRQAAQDTNAANSSASVLASRVNSKGSTLYCTADWDLVDAIKTGKCSLDGLKDEDLPESFRAKTPAERKECVDNALKAREEIQAQILKLGAERDKYVAAERAKRAQGGQDTLDSAMIRAIREQAAGLHFTFE
jgi:hypothetical protein